MLMVRRFRGACRLEADSRRFHFHTLQDSLHPYRRGRPRFFAALIIQFTLLNGEAFLRGVVRSSMPSGYSGPVGGRRVERNHGSV